MLARRDAVAGGGRCRRRGAVAACDLQPRPPTLTDKDTIVLADFTNTTGDPVFDDTLRQGLAVQLAAVAVPQPRLRRAHPKNAAVDEPAGGCATDSRRSPRTCASGPASAAVLEGSIATLGSQYVLGLRARNCTTGDILADEQAQAARKEEVLAH